MAGLQQKTVRPRLACEITSAGVIAARAADKTPRLEVFTSRRFNEGTIAPGLTLPNILNPEALRAALSGALGAVAGKIERRNRGIARCGGAHDASGF